MILEITRLEEGEITSKDGNPLPGLTITGFQHNQDGELEDEPYEKFLMEWKNADEIETVKQIGVGGTVELKMKQKKGTRFWDCIGAEIIEVGAGEESVSDNPDPDAAGGNVPDDEDDPTVAANREESADTAKAAKAVLAAEAAAKKAKAVLAKSKAAAAKKAKAAAKPKEKTADKVKEAELVSNLTASPAMVAVDLTEMELRTVALTSSMDLTGHMMKAPERVKGLIKAKDTPEIVTQMTLLNASKIESYLKGDFEKELSSNPDDLLEGGEVDADEPTLPGE